MRRPCSYLSRSPVRASGVGRVRLQVGAGHAIEDFGDHAELAVRGEVRDADAAELAAENGERADTVAAAALGMLL